MHKQIAGWFGRNEHWYAEMLGIALLVNMCHYKDWWSIIIMVTWLIYYISHRLEKLFYGRGLR